MTSRKKPVRKKRPATAPPEKTSAPKRKKKKVARKKKASRRVRATDMVEDSSVHFSTGCSLLDEALGGGLMADRVCQIIGESATGKSLLGLEAGTNFLRTFTGSQMTYFDTEAAFNPSYAASLGVDVDALHVAPLETVEELEAEITNLCDLQKKAGAKAKRRLVIVDSVDALSTTEERNRDLDTKTMGMEKARKLSTLFRVHTGELHRNRITLLFMSQVRENVDGGKFAKRTKTSGGKAIRFYCSQVIELNSMGKEDRTVRGTKRVIGVNVRARVEKSRSSGAHQSVDFPIRYGYGVDDARSCLNYLVTTKRVGNLPVKPTLGDAKKWITEQAQTLDDVEWRALVLDLKTRAVEAWREVEDILKPPKRKYS